jgi:ABC-type nitrate/sulfonate/bicarbonate transport system ATPase subunit
MLKLDKVFFRFEQASFPFLNIEKNNLDWEGNAVLNGGSGSGKTTFFRVLSGWYENSENCHCTINGISSNTKEVRFIGLHESLLPWLTVRNNVAFLSQANTDLATDLKLVGLDNACADMYPTELSLGMYKRVELVIAVRARPKILLIDEFFGSLDEKSKKCCMHFLVSERGKQMNLFTSHESSTQKWIGGPQFAFEKKNGMITKLKCQG